MPPKHEGDKAADNTINWVEFRDALLASHTALQTSQLAMQTSIQELSHALLRHIGADI